MLWFQSCTILQISPPPQHQAYNRSFRRSGHPTVCLKVTIGRPRPNMAALCCAGARPAWRDATPTVTAMQATAPGGYSLCSSASKQAKEAFTSFLSGHASWSASGGAGCCSDQMFTEVLLHAVLLCILKEAPYVPVVNAVRLVCGCCFAADGFHKTTARVSKLLCSH